MRMSLLALGLAGLLALPALAVAAPPLQTGPLGIRPTAEEIELGRKLFFDKRLSQNGTVSCASCHDPRKGWSDGLPQAVGIGGQVGTRNSPTIINATYVPMVFWDGRVVGTSAQSLLPLSNPIEMGRQSEADVVTRLRLIPGYVSLFARVYGVDPVAGSPITGVNLGRALSAFESSVVSFDAPIDRYLAGEKDALSPDAEVGYRLFKKAGCTSCHPAPHFTDHLFHNNGMEFASKWRVTDHWRWSVLPPQARTAESVRAFKTPTLREIARTAPYNHAGTYPTLERVVRHYAAGGANYQGRIDAYTDPRVVQIGRLRLTETQERYLVLFLEEAFASPKYPLITEPTLP